MDSGCSPEEMENKLISEYERLHDINNDIANRLKSDTKHHANSFITILFFFNLLVATVLTN
jgi:hypothetical protein